MSEDRKIRVKKVKRRCDVRRCNNKESYLISRSVESGNSIIVCKDCLKEALAEINKFERGFAGVNMPSNDVVSEPEQETEETSETEIPANDELKPYTCDNCGREFTTERGLEVHKRTCGKD